MNFCKIKECYHYQPEEDSWCALGYKSQPKTRVATENAIKNGTAICPKNPFRRRVLKEDT